MSKFIISTCLLLFWSFYEMSGGADFEPPERQAIALAPTAETPELPMVAVTPAARTPTPIAEVVNASFTAELVIIAAPEPVVDAVAMTPAATEVAAVTTPALPVRLVSGDWVNMRDGPSTSFAVLDTLPKGTKAEVLELSDDGWAQIRLIDSGKTGWMAERLLSEG